VKNLSDSAEIDKDEELEEEEIPENEMPAPPQQRISPLEIKALNQLQIVQFLDNITEDPLLFLYNKTVRQFKYEIEKFIEESDSDLKDIWNENKIELENILKYSEELAIQNGYKRSIQKDSIIWSLPIYGVAIGVSFAMFFFVPQDIIYYVLMIPLLFLCVSNSLVTKYIMNTRMKFRSEKTSFLKEQMKTSIERIRNVNQIILNDITDIIKENKFDLTRFKAYLYNKDYKNIKVIETKEQQKVPIYLINIDFAN